MLKKSEPYKNSWIEILIKNNFCNNIDRKVIAKNNDLTNTTVSKAICFLIQKNILRENQNLLLLTDKGKEIQEMLLKINHLLI